MSKSLTWRIGLIVLFFVGSFIYLIPTLSGGKLPSWWGGLLPKDKIHLGLDLQGGTHLVLEVETPKAVEGRLDLVITVDNTVAHLCGALGMPVWILLPFSAEWRYARVGAALPWYPSARLFRQPQ